jgi:hypothetical protein
MSGIDSDSHDVISVSEILRTNVGKFTVKGTITDLCKLLELSEKSLGEIPQLDEPNGEQRRWIGRKMKASAAAWKRWFE